MITKKEIQGIIEEAHANYSQVAETLFAMKNSKVVTPKKLLDIQTILTESLYGLSSMYTNLNHEKNNYIKRKEQLNLIWFKNRLKLISKYQNAIDYSISIGKYLGDHFAWIFYRLDRNLLKEHYNNDRIFYMPTGIGGLGELEYVKKFRFFNNKLMIYHGITSFLRLGDVSIFDIEESRVTAIGEIKTKEINEDELSITLSLVGDEKKDVTIFDELINKSNNGKSKKIQDLLSPKIRKRLNRQLSKISKSVGKKSKKFKKLDISGGYKFERIDDLYKRTSYKEVKLLKIGDGLILGCYKPSKRTLFKKLFNDYSDEFKSKLKNFDSKVLDILTPKSEDTHLIISDVINPNPKLYLKSSSTPFLFWPVDKSLFKEVVFF